MSDLNDFFQGLNQGLQTLNRTMPGAIRNWMAVDKFQAEQEKRKYDKSQRDAFRGALEDPEFHTAVGPNVLKVMAAHQITDPRYLKMAMQLRSGTEIVKTHVAQALQVIQNPKSTPAQVRRAKNMIQVAKTGATRAERLQEKKDFHLFKQAHRRTTGSGKNKKTVYVVPITDPQTGQTYKVNMTGPQLARHFRQKRREARLGNRPARGSSSTARANLNIRLSGQEGKKAKAAERNIGRLQETRAGGWQEKTGPTPFHTRVENPRLRRLTAEAEQHRAEQKRLYNKAKAQAEPTAPTGGRGRPPRLWGWRPNQPRTGSAQGRSYREGDRVFNRKTGQWATLRRRGGRLVWVVEVK